MWHCLVTSKMEVMIALLSVAKSSLSFGLLETVQGHNFFQRILQPRQSTEELLFLDKLSLAAKQFHTEGIHVCLVADPESVLWQSKEAPSKAALCWAPRQWAVDSGLCPEHRPRIF